MKKQWMSLVVTSALASSLALGVAATAFAVENKPAAAKPAVAPEGKPVAAKSVVAVESKPAMAKGAFESANKQAKSSPAEKSASAVAKKKERQEADEDKDTPSRHAALEKAGVTGERLAKVLAALEKVDGERKEARTVFESKKEALVALTKEGTDGALVKALGELQVAQAKLARVRDKEWTAIAKLIKPVEQAWFRAARISDDVGSRPSPVAPAPKGEPVAKTSEKPAEKSKTAAATAAPASEKAKTVAAPTEKSKTVGAAPAVAAPAVAAPAKPAAK